MSRKHMLDVIGSLQGGGFQARIIRSPRGTPYTIEYRRVYDDGTTGLWHFCDYTCDIFAAVEVAREMVREDHE